MIGVAEEMEQAVHQAEGELVGRALPETPGLLGRPFHGHGYIAEKTRRLPPALPGRWEGQHVGRPVPLQEASVQSPDPGVVREEQAHLPGGGAFFPENESGQGPDGARVESETRLLVFDLDAHPGLK